MIMPNLDGTGPMSQGPRTGRGMGNCPGAGGSFGGFVRGGGWGRFCRWCPWVNGTKVSKEEQKKMLEEEKKMIEKEISDLDKS